MGKIGRYQIESEIGRGSMGVVYLAQDPQVRRRLAIKTFELRPGLSLEQESEYTLRFLREAQAAGVLSHPGIVTIYDAGSEPDTGVPFIAMEYVEGQSLRQILNERLRLPADQVFAMGETLAGALAAAHEAGIVHRDIKPANILVRARDGAVKIVDFGVARLSTSELTGAGDVFGSPAYMSPEQFRGAEVDGRSDLFSLAVVLYQALCGERPFTGDDLSTLAYTVVHTTPPPLSSWIDGFPSSLDRFFDRAMAKNPADRFPDGHAFGRALAAARQGKSANQRARPGLFAAMSGLVLRRRGMSPADEAPAARRRRFKPSEAAFAIVMLALALLPAFWALWSGGSARGGIVRAGSEPVARLARAVAAPMRGPSAPDAADQVAPRKRQTPVEVTTPTSRAPAAGKVEGSGSEKLAAARAVNAADSAPPSAQAGKSAPVAAAGDKRRKKAPAPTAIPIEPEPEKIPEPELVATQLPPPVPSIPRAEETSAWLNLNARSRLKEGRLVLFVDGKEVFSRDLSTRKAEEAGNLEKRKWYQRKQEAFEARIEISPGKHEVMVRILPEGKDAVYEDKTVIEVGAAETLGLHLVAGKVLGSPIILKTD